MLLLALLLRCLAAAGSHACTRAPRSLPLCRPLAQAVVGALPVKPMLLREPCPDMVLDRFGPSPDAPALDAPRIYSSDLARERGLGGGMWGVM